MFIIPFILIFFLKFLLELNSLCFPSFFISLNSVLLVKGEDFNIDLDSIEYTCSQQLREAYNAAVVQLQSTREAYKLLEKYDVPYYPLYYCALSPPATVSFPIPRKEDALYDILKNQRIRVGTTNAAWGASGDYTQNVPVGFFPDYLKEIIKKINLHYKSNIQIEYVPVDKDDIKYLNEKKIHMTNIYKIISGVDHNGHSIHDNYFIGCPTFLSDNIMLVRKDSKISSLEDIVVSSGMSSLTHSYTLGFQTEANYNIFADFFQHLINKKIYKPPNSKTDAISDLVNKKVVALISTSRFPIDLINKYSDELIEIDLKIYLSMGAIFKKTMDSQCLKDSENFPTVSERFFMPK